MARPCVCENYKPGQDYDRSQCVRCWLYHNSERHRKVWDGETNSARPNGRVPVSKRKRQCAPGERPAKSKEVPASQQQRGLGDMVESALTAIGVTSERVSKWLGRPCGCKERRDKLNRLGAWAKRVLSGKTEDAAQHLESLVEEPK